MRKWEEGKRRRRDRTRRNMYEGHGKVRIRWKLEMEGKEGEKREQGREGKRKDEDGWLKGGCGGGEEKERKEERWMGDRGRRIDWRARGRCARRGDIGL